MLSNVNNKYQPSFKEMYILKGIGKDVKCAEEKIYEKCNTGMKNLTHSEITPYPHFYAFNMLYLTRFCSETQPNVQCIIATNKHSKNISNWLHIFGEKTQEIDVPPGAKIDIKKMIKLFLDLKKENDAVIQPFMNAEQSNKNGIFDPMADFLIDRFKEAKIKLQQIKEVAVVPPGKIKEVDAKEALNAMSENKFNYISGKILK